MLGERALLAQGGGAGAEDLLCHPPQPLSDE